MDDNCASKHRAREPSFGCNKSALSDTACSGYDDELSKVDSEFLTWVHRGFKSRKLPPLTDLMEFCKTHYRAADKKAHQLTTVTRRTLSPVVDHEILYKTKSIPDNSIFEDSQHWGKLNMFRGPFTPNYQRYSDIGSRYDVKPKTDGNAILIKQLSDGLTEMEIQYVRDMGRKKQRTSSFSQDGDAVVALMKSVRAKTKQKIRDNAVESRSVQARQTNTALQEGTKKMYELLHETEHRLLSIQAGGSYLSHLSACKKRRRIYNELRNPDLCNTRYRIMQPRPADSDRSLSMLRKRKKPTSSSRRTTLTFEDLTISGKFSANVAHSKLRQIYYDKLICIHIILCTMTNMKQPKTGLAPISWQQLRILRKDTQSSSSYVDLNNPSEKRRSLKKLTKSVLPWAKKLPNLPTVKVLPQISKIRTAESAATETGESSTSTSKMTLGNMLRSKLGLISALKTSVNSANKLQTLKGPVFPDSRRKSSRSSMAKDGNNFLRRRSRNVSPFAVHEHDMFDPATITWEEFVRWGNKESPKDRKMRFAAGTKTYNANTTTDSTKDLSAKAIRLSSSCVSEDVAKKALGYSSSTDAIRKSVSHMWQLMRKSFIEQLSQSASQSMDGKPGNLAQNSKLMQMFGLDGNNPISHLKLNWMKIKMRGNKMIIREINQRNRKAVGRYKAVIHSKEISDTSQWKHKWSQNFQARRRALDAERTDQYVECIETLIEEARELQLQDNPLVSQVLDKIRHAYLNERIKYLTIFRGQGKMRRIVMSLPAFELCTLQMQLAMQFVLVDILQGETDALIPMFKERGLPLHPGIMEHTKLPNMAGITRTPKLNIHDFIKTNKILSSVPPAKTGMSRDLIKKLERNVIYGFP